MTTLFPLTVTQITAYIKRLLDGDDALRAVWLEGEVSNFKRHAPSGHCYFTLKDASAAIPCVMWRTAAQQLPRLPVDGEQVEAFGSVSVYETQGRYQFYVDRMTWAGVGRLHEQLERLKARLAAEGLFDPERKRPLPPWPRRVGVVTSAQAAALRDILRTLAWRYPLVEVLLAPAAVQGVEAPAQLVQAIGLLNTWAATVEPVDVIIVARGGGSIEELWAFNDERVARAVASSRIPVISGVGHETDFTLTDFTADQRASTPTSAAALAVPDRQALLGQARDLQARLVASMAGRVASERQRLAQAARTLRRASPQSQLASRRQRVDDLSQVAVRVTLHRLELQRALLNGLQARLRGLDPAAVLARGYAVVRRVDTGAIVTSVSQVTAGDQLRITVRDGQFDSQVVR